jgi:hypothetical protein
MNGVLVTGKKRRATMKSKSLRDLIKLSVSVMAAIFLVSCSSTQPQRTTYNYYKGYDIPGNTHKLKAVSEAMREAISLHGGASVNVRLMPQEVPNIPCGKFKLEPVTLGRLFTMDVLKCDDCAVSVIGGSGQGASSSGLGQSQSQTFLGCVYPFKKDDKLFYRTYMIMRYTQQSKGGIEGALAKGIKGAFGGDEGIAERKINQSEAKLKSIIPDAVLIETSD